jgi:hypothetical protein
MTGVGRYAIIVMMGILVCILVDYATNLKGCLHYSSKVVSTVWSTERSDVRISLFSPYDLRQSEPLQAIFGV